MELATLTQSGVITKMHPGRDSGVIAWFDVEVGASRPLNPGAPTPAIAYRVLVSEEIAAPLARLVRRQPRINILFTGQYQLEYDEAEGTVAHIVIAQDVAVRVTDPLLERSTADEVRNWQR